MSIMGIKRGFLAGYTLVELMVVVVLLSILVTGVIWVDSALIGTTKQSRDAERASDMRSVALIFEQYYQTNPSSDGSTYPTTSEITSSLSDIVSNQEILTPPNVSSPAFSTASDASTQDPSIDEYIYQPYTAADALCTSSPPCVRFMLYYRSEYTDEVNVIDSRHQQ